jgi:hypothetical protein
MSGRAIERRKHARVVTKGSVTMTAPGYVQRARLANIGAHGIYVLTNIRPLDRLLQGTVKLQIRLDTGHAEWFRTEGRVVRIRDEGLAIMFDTPPVELLAMIDELGTASHARHRMLAIVLIDDDERRRNRMADGFNAAGCTVIEAATPLEAIVRLGESSFEPDVIAVSDTQPGGQSDDMRAFVEREHPTVKLIRIGDEVLRPDGLTNWLSSAGVAADLADRVRQALVAPRGSD